MRRKITRWIAIIVLLVAMGVLLSWLIGNRHNVYRLALGMSLGVLGFTLMLLTLWPKPGQVDRASLVFMAVSMLPPWLVASGKRWRIRWRLVADSVWGLLLLLALTAVVVALLGDSVTALFLALVAAMLNYFGMLIVGAARLPASRRQR